MLQKKHGYASPLAVAVVLSGQYEDDVDCLNEVVYTGEGGNDLLGSKCQIKDQVMLHGNLALKVWWEFMILSILVMFFPFLVPLLGSHFDV